MSPEDIKRKRLNFVWTQQEAIDAIMHGLTTGKDEGEVRSLLEATIGLSYAVGSLETITHMNDSLKAEL